MSDLFHREYDRLRALVEARLETYFTADAPAKSLADAMRYSALSGGKRVRPVLALAFAKACGVIDNTALDAACAVELLHTYSLIHDDLPAMDDDDTRRGKPSNHIVFGEWRAILAGDALQAEAFSKIANCGLEPPRVAKMLSALARAAVDVCHGQTLDLEAVESGSADLYAIHALKTASLFVAAAKIGVLAAGGTERQLTAASEYARAVGLAFQIRDDILDKDGFYTAYGIQKCEELIESNTIKAKNSLKGAFGGVRFLSSLAEELAGRSS
ncbi:MAG: polyprenyl synthetase family protein [Oscillospiraceae bacterium]|jgi:geranylgeranyl diphosphate synthase type II|nr:polyprenyl synthetase family protein [Oscillospiraceae bacterium]